MAGKGEEGIALLLVLWVLIMLTVIVGQFCYTMRTETNITRNFRDSAQAAYLARAGLKKAVYRIMSGGVNSGGKKNNPWRVNMDIPPQPFAGGFFKVHIGNESGKVNINSARSHLLRFLFSGMNIDSRKSLVIASSIQDWRDRDNLHRGYGAENEYYTSLPEPYKCNNGPFNSVYELIRVRGMNREIYEKVFQGRVTVYPRDVLTTDTPYYQVKRHEKVEPDRININAASPAMLLQLPGMNEEKVAKIRQFRRKKDMEAQSELLKLVGSKTFRKIIDYISFEYSNYYDIEVSGRMKDSGVSRTVRALVFIDQERGRYKILSFKTE